MEKIILLSFAMTCYIYSYGQDTETTSKDTTDTVEPDKEQPIVIKYYQTTEPDGSNSFDEKKLNDNVNSSQLQYYETVDVDNQIDQLEEEIKQVEAESILTYFGDDDVTSLDNSNQSESIEVKYYQTVEPKKELVQVKVNDREVYPKPQKKNEVRTLYSKRNRNGGGYGALGVKASEFNDNTLVMAGVKVAWVINRSIGVGIDVWGVIPTVDYTAVPTRTANESVALVGGYGGLLFEPILFSNQVFHLIFPISAGMGWLGYQTYGEDYNFDESVLVDEDVFWYVEPSAAIEINVARFCRLNIGASKRFTQDLELIVTDPSGFRDWNYFVALKFGGF